MGFLNISSITNTFESNNVANKGLIEIGGYAVPGVIMANNKVEARERAEKAAMAFSFSFIAPLIFLPLLNKQLLKSYKITETFKNNEQKIMNLSKKYLAKDAKYMIEGIKELKEELRPAKTHLGLDNILNQFKGREDKLKNKLLKAHDKILFLDVLFTGGLMGSLYWISNAITKKKTGRDGFSAEYKMAEKNYVENKAENYKKNYNKNILKTISILATGALGLSLIFKKGMSAKGGNFIKKHAAAFDYNEGIYMSRLVLMVISFFGDVPNTLLSSRDKEEFKYNAIKNIVFYSTFFGGDVILNNIVARTLDKTCKNVKLVNKEKLPPKPSLWKNLTAPLYTLKEINNQKNWAPAVLNKTKRFKIGMFWANIIAVTAFMGFGTPYLLNKMVKNKVQKETQKQ